MWIAVVTTAYHESLHYTSLSLVIDAMPRDASLSLVIDAMPRDATVVTFGRVITNGDDAKPSQNNAVAD